MADTIAAMATAPGLAGVAIIRVSGPDSWDLASRLMRAPLVEPNRACCRALYDDSSTLIDRALVLGFKAPKSYTGEDVVEFQVHGGAVTPRRVLEALFKSGARLARRGEFTERAFLNGKLDYDQAESVLNLIHAKTVRAADVALQGLAGEKQRMIRALYDSALDISSTLEHALDVSEEELPASFYPSIQAKMSALETDLKNAIRVLKEKQILENGALVVLAGAPNAGKSSLMNALLKENRAIVSDVPGTTRDSIEAWMDLEGFPIRLVDTAGLRETSDAIEAEGVKRSEDLIARADVVLGLDCDRGLRVHSKCDLGPGEGINVSAKTGEGLSDLKSAIVSALADRLPPSPDPTLSTLLSILHSPSSIFNFQFSIFNSPSLVLLANSVRAISESLGSLIGATYSADLLEKLFSKFCVGK